MATQRDIKRRIDSVRNTRKITRAMELVASAKLRRSQERIEALRPYAAGMRRLMSQAAKRSTGLAKLPLLEERPKVENALVVTITGDRGLAGAFNVNILRAGYDAAADLHAEGAESVAYVPVGKKGAGTLRFRGLEIDRTFQGFSSEPTFADASQVAEHLVERFVSGEVDRVLIVYNAFKSVLEQRVTLEQLLPVERETVEQEEDEETVDLFQQQSLADFEPSAEVMLERLSAHVRRHDHLPRAGRERGGRERRAPQRHAQRHRQCRPVDRRPDARDEPRAPGGDHPGDPRGRGGRRRPLGLGRTVQGEAR